ncbi:MAG TPA: YggT family protein [Solirubrobacteraceae bacterium]|jgi:YggT family protein|nr:YggT family protein [Solirubrobacteraceae bacterium]
MSVYVPLLTVRSQIADYVDTLIYVYLLVIFAYIVSTWVFAMGLRIPYSRYTDAVLGFLRDVTEPYLRLFRNILPRFGPMDLSPIAAILVLYVVRAVVVPLIRG